MLVLIDISTRNSTTLHQLQSSQQQSSPSTDCKPPPQTKGLAPHPGFKQPESNLTEFGRVVDSSTLLEGVDLSSFKSNSKYSTPAGSLGGSFPMLPISMFSRVRKNQIPSFQLGNMQGKISDLQPHYEASRNQTGHLPCPSRHSQYSPVFYLVVCGTGSWRIGAGAQRGWPWSRFW